MNIATHSVPPKGARSGPTKEHPEGKDLNRLTLSVDSPAQCENGWWTWLSITPAGPPGEKVGRGFKVWIESPGTRGWPGVVGTGEGNRRYAWPVPKGTTMIHVENDGVIDLGVTLATTRAPR